MTTMNVSLPDKMKEWVEAQTETGRLLYASGFKFFGEARADS
jgi:Arc/MetJ-type ribon-helix-helix transcriptional regulator